MHANTEQLLSLRDSQAVEPAVAEHVESCEQCRREIRRLDSVRSSLRQLPPVAPPRGLWQAVAVGSLQKPAGQFWHGHTAQWGTGLAIAASFVLGLALLLRGGDDRGNPAEAPLETTPPATVSQMVESGNAASLPALQARSRRLEALRAAMPREPEVQRARTAMTIAELEDRIALVDVRLHAADELGLTEAQKHALWKERVNLMQSLVQVEYARRQSPRY